MAVGRRRWWRGAGVGLTLESSLGIGDIYEEAEWMYAGLVAASSAFTGSPRFRLSENGARIPPRGLPVAGYRVSLLVAFGLV